MIDFSKVLEASIDGVEGEMRVRVTPGKYRATIQNVEQHVAKSGAKALMIEYAISPGQAAEGGSIREFLYYQGKAETGSQLLTFGFSKIKRRLLAGGFTEETLKTFKSPKSPKEKGDYKRLLDQPVVIVVEEKTQTKGEYAGKKRNEVVRVEQDLAETNEVQSA